MTEDREKGKGISSKYCPAPARFIAHEECDEKSRKISDDRRKLSIRKKERTSQKGGAKEKAMKGTFKKVFATVAGAAVAFSGFAASAGIANAYSATDPSVKDGTLKINNTSSHTLKAFKIASYNSDFKVIDASTPTENQNAVEGFTLIDNPTYSTQIAAALVAAGQSSGHTDINSLYGIERDVPWGFASMDHYTQDTAVRKFAQSLYNDLKNETGTNLQVADPSVNTLTEGLYLVIDTSTSSTAGKESVSVPMLVGTTYNADHIDANAKKDSSSNYLVVNSFEGNINMKNDEIDRSKRVVDFSSDPVVMDKPSYAVGEKVNFQLKTEVPQFAGYSLNRQFKIHDTLYKGLTFNSTKQSGGSTQGITSVKVGNTTLTEDTDYTVSSTTAANGDTDIVINMYNYVNTVSSSPDVAPAYGADVVVTLWATLNSNAKFANLDNGVVSPVTDGIDTKNGNYNQLSVEYSNNPQDMTTTRTTTVATVNVYSYELKIYKVDKNGDALSGAGFLVKRTSAVSGTRDGANLANNEYLKTDGTHDTTSNVYYTNGSVADPTATGGYFRTDGSGYVTIRGLSEGTYLVSEKVAPATYDTAFAKDFVFTITPTYTVASATDQDDTTWVGNGDEVLSALAESVTVDGNPVDTSNKYVAFNNAGQNSSTVTVTNYRSRSELPLTGAAGIAVFTVIGAALLSVAAYFGIRSRKNAEI